jgi:hypothetical protein
MIEGPRPLTFPNASSLPIAVLIPLVLAFEIFLLQVGHYFTKVLLTPPSLALVASVVRSGEQGFHPSLQQIHSQRIWQYTDKGTTHSYIRVYERLFASKRLTARRVVEIGILGGGSILLWHEYFPNAMIYGLDITPTCPPALAPLARSSPRVKLLIGQNAYSGVNVERNFVNRSIGFDIFVDDGPHTLDSMKEAIKQYLPLLNPGGIFVIEDLQSMDWPKKLRELVPASDLPYVYVLDLKDNKGRYDDIMFIIDREVRHVNLVS